MLEALTQTISNTDFTVNRANIVRWLRPFAATTPTFYLLFVIPFAFAGYFALLLFPLLSLWLFLKLIAVTFFSCDHQHWPYPLMIITVSCYPSARDHPLHWLVYDLPVVRVLASASRKHQSWRGLVKGLQQHYGNPRLRKNTDYAQKTKLR